MNGYYVTIETCVTYTTFVEADNKDDAYMIAKDRFIAGEIEPDNPNPIDIDYDKIWVLAKCQYSNDNKIGYAVFYDIDKLGCVTLMFKIYEDTNSIEFFYCLLEVSTRLEKKTCENILKAYLKEKGIFVED